MGKICVSTLYSPGPAVGDSEGGGVPLLSNLSLSGDGDGFAVALEISVWERMLQGCCLCGLDSSEKLSTLLHQREKSVRSTG